MEGPDARKQGPIPGTLFMFRTGGVYFGTSICTYRQCRDCFLKSRKRNNRSASLQGVFASGFSFSDGGMLTDRDRSIESHI